MYDSILLTCFFAVLCFIMVALIFILILVALTAINLIILKIKVTSGKVIKTQGVVTKVKTIMLKHKYFSNKRKVYIPTIKYNDGETEYEIERDYAFYDKLEEGKEITVYYDPENHKEFRLVWDNIISFSGLIIILISVILACILAFVGKSVL